MKDLPLDGVRVIDLSWVIAGPTATRFLAMMGVEMIKVGSARRSDPSTRGAPFQAYNQSKLYCALNVSVPEGLEDPDPHEQTADTADHRRRRR